VKVLALWRYPVKSLLGERLAEASVGRAGIEGDRRWRVCDAATGEPVVQGAANGEPRLWACRAELRGDGVAVTLPDGTVAEGADAAPALSALLGREVVLRGTEGPGAGTVFDSGAHHTAPLHLVTTGTLARFGLDERRMRPNVVLEADGAFGEDRLVGGTLRGPGGLEVSVVIPTPRCVVPTRAREELPRMPGLLKEMMRANPVDLGPFGEQPCAGVYAEVAAGGRIAVGDELAGTPAGVAQRTALDLALARIATTAERVS
jgi:uncharacterized protein YcbX